MFIYISILSKLTQRIYTFKGGIIRDNWMCTGDRYATVLQETKRLNATIYGMQNFMNRTFIVATGVLPAYIFLYRYILMYL
jgi:hypothetical protein